MRRFGEVLSGGGAGTDPGLSGEIIFLWNNRGQVAGTGGRGEGGLRLLLDGWTDGCAYIIIEDSVGRLVLETVPDPILGVPHIKTLQKLFCKTLNYSCSSPRDLYSLNLR